MSTEDLTSKPILVTKPFLPPLGESLLALESIWESQITYE